MEDLIRILHEGHHSCVIRKGAEIKTYEGKGILDLLTLLNNNKETLQGAEIADKVVGKAAASLLVMGGIRKIYADLLSQSASNLLQQEGIPVTYGTLVPFIKRMDFTDICPMEALTLDATTAEEAVNRIRKKIGTN